MTKPLPPSSPARAPRVDAQRNRERILAVAREAFQEHGADATMDDMARRAGVGAGTLYRHFPTRNHLIEAVFRAEVERLIEAGQRFAVSLPPLEALRTWMLLFIDYVVAKLLILPALDSLPGGSAGLIEGTRGMVHGAFFQLIRRAVESGDLAQDTRPEDLVRAFLGIFHTTSLPDWEPSARRIVDLLLDGSRRRFSDAPDAKRG